MSTGSGAAATILVVVCRAGNMVFVSCVSGGRLGLGSLLVLLEKTGQKVVARHLAFERWHTHRTVWLQGGKARRSYQSLVFKVSDDNANDKEDANSPPMSLLPCLPSSAGRSNMPVSTTALLSTAKRSPLCSRTTRSRIMSGGTISPASSPFLATRARGVYEGVYEGTVGLQFTAGGLSVEDLLRLCSRLASWCWAVARDSLRRYSATTGRSSPRTSEEDEEYPWTARRSIS